MSNSIGSFEARTHLPALLERVQKGEHITITKHGVPVAMLVPAKASSHQKRKQVIAALKEFGRGGTLPQGITGRDLIEEGRRF
ncbi:MAG TPA: type II toxin-antitoxin system prevent-host-death family antitoxin [Bryobacteraceae bacterium]|jgi:prevent-host-death family protein